MESKSPIFSRISTKKKKNEKKKEQSKEKTNEKKKTHRRVRSIGVDSNSSPHILITKSKDSTNNNTKQNGFPTLQRKRSLSTPNTPAEALSILELRSLYGQSDDCMDFKYCWLTKDTLFSLLEKYNVATKKEKADAAYFANVRKKKEEPEEVKKPTNRLITPTNTVLHAWWGTKKEAGVSESLLKEILPLVVSTKPIRWTFYIMIKAARISQIEHKPSPTLAPLINATVSYNEGFMTNTSKISSYDPTFNETFYFSVQKIATDFVKIAVYITLMKGKETREGSCVGVCELDVRDFYAPNGYYCPLTTWVVLKNPSNSQPTESFVNIAVQLVPDNVESFTDLKNQTVRILPDTERYIEQFGDHIPKNKLRGAS